MGGFSYDDPADRPYGPTNPDYEYDRHVQEQIDMEAAPQAISDLGVQLFDQAAELARMQASYLQLGRQQKALEVVLWIRSHSDALKGAPVESLLALCNKELR